MEKNEDVVLEQYKEEENHVVNENFVEETPIPFKPFFVLCCCLLSESFSVTMIV